MTGEDGLVIKKKWKDGGGRSRQVEEEMRDGKRCVSVSAMEKVTKGDGDEGGTTGE